MKILIAILLVSLTALAVVKYTGKVEDPITVAIPRGYAPPVAMGERSWQDHLAQIMAQGIEDDAVAASPSEAKAAEVKPPLPGARSASEMRHARRPAHGHRAHAGRHSAHKRAGRRR